MGANAALRGMLKWWSGIGVLHLRMPGHDFFPSCNLLALKEYARPALFAPPTRNTSERSIAVVEILLASALPVATIMKITWWD